MSQKITRIIICTLAIMCVFCSSLTAFAENETVDSDFNIQPIEPTTQEEIIETEEPTEEPTEKPTEKPTEEPTKKPNKKPTQAQTERPQERPQNNNSQTNQNNTPERETEEETTKVELPEGAFYVYLERNNGERRLETMMEEPGVLPKPNDPKRKGYIFDGWYKDPEFKKEWSFLKDVAKEEMVIYAKWIADESTVEFDIVVEKMVGGKIETNPAKASKGEPVFITVTPDEGKRLVPGSLLINGKATDVFSFLMPKGKVTISAAFEDIPESVEGEKEEKNFLPLIIVGAVLGVVIIAFVVVIIRRRSDFNADLDPDEVYEDTQEDEIVWIDDSITIEDGFKGGKKIAENVEPDYGAPDADIED